MNYYIRKYSEDVLVAALVIAMVSFFVFTIVDVIV